MWSLQCVHGNLVSAECGRHKSAELATSANYCDAVTPGIFHRMTSLLQFAADTVSAWRRCLVCCGCKREPPKVPPLLLEDGSDPAAHILNRQRERIDG